MVFFKKKFYLSSISKLLLSNSETLLSAIYNCSWASLMIYSRFLFSFSNDYTSLCSIWTFLLISSSLQIFLTILLFFPSLIEFLETSNPHLLRSSLISVSPLMSSSYFFIMFGAVRSFSRSSVSNLPPDFCKNETLSVFSRFLWVYRCWENKWIQSSASFGSIIKESER